MTTIYTGTADVVNGDATVAINTGDPLSAAIADAGFLVALDGVVYFIASLTDTSTIELTRDYAGTSGTVPIEIWPVSQVTSSLIDVVTLVRDTRAKLSVFDKNSQGLFFTHIGVTGDADPGPGNLALDNADPAQATELYIDYLDANDAHHSVAALLALFAAGYTIRIRSMVNAAFYEFDVAGNDDMTGYFRVALSHVGSSGIIADGEPVSLSWVRSGEGLQFDEAGDFAGRDAYDGEDAGFIYMSSDGDGADLTGTVLFVKASNDSGDWSPGFPLTGPKGDRGWSPVLSIVGRNGGAEAVVRLISWVGGEGTAPTAGVGQYLMPGGFTSNIANAYNIKGIKGDPQGIRLDMVTSTDTSAMSAGQFRTDNATFGSITALRFNADAKDLGETSIADWLARLDDVGNAVSRGTLRFQSATDASVFMEFAVTGDLATEANYYELPVTPVAGARPGSQTTFAAYFTPAGADGEDGADGTDPGALYNWSEDTADADPGAGYIAADNGDLSSATTLFVSKTNRAGDDLSVFLLGLAASTNSVKGRVVLTRSGGNAQTTANVTGVTDALGYVKIVIEAQSGADGFIGEDAVSLQFMAVGDQGSASAASLAASIAAAGAKATPHDDDLVALVDSEDSESLKKITIAELRAALADHWASQPPGVPIPVWTHLGEGMEPPTDDPRYRYIKLTASDAYNSGVLTSESVSGSAPLVLATAVIDDEASPFDGETVQLINTERRAIRAGSSGTVQNDQMQQIVGSVGWSESTGILANANATTGVFGGASNGRTRRPSSDATAGLDLTFDSANSPGARAGNETRSKNIGATYYMRIR